jgi:hypothetical protein
MFIKNLEFLLLRQVWQACSAQPRFAPNAVTNTVIVSAIRGAVLDKKARTHYIPAVAKASESVVADHAKTAAHIL